MKIELSDSSKYDFKIYGKKNLSIKIYEIEDIEDLIAEIEQEMK